MFKVGDIISSETTTGKLVYVEVTELRDNNCLVIKPLRGNRKLRMVINLKGWTIDKSYHRKNKLLKIKGKLNG